MFWKNVFESLCLVLIAAIIIAVYIIGEWASMSIRSQPSEHRINQLEEENRELKWELEKIKEAKSL